MTAPREGADLVADQRNEYRAAHDGAVGDARKRLATGAEIRTCGLSAEEIQRAEDACRTCPACDVGMAAGCNCDPEPRAVIAYLLTEIERLTEPTEVTR